MLDIKSKKQTLTPFVDRATKCLATAAACENASMTYKVDYIYQRADAAPVTHIFGMFKEPRFGWLSIGDGLLGGESL